MTEFLFGVLCGVAIGLVVALAALFPFIWGNPEDGLEEAHD